MARRAPCPSGRECSITTSNSTPRFWAAGVADRGVPAGRDQRHRLGRLRGTLLGTGGSSGFEYAYVGLPGVPGLPYATGENLLGVALGGSMIFPTDRRAELYVEGLKRIAGSGENDYRQYLLAECLEAYSDLDEGQKARVQALLHTEAYREVEPLMKTTYERGIEDGRERGIVQGELRLTLRLMEFKFGPLSPQVKQQVEALSEDALAQLQIDLLEAKNPRGTSPGRLKPRSFAEFIEDVPAEGLPGAKPQHCWLESERDVCIVSASLEPDVLTDLLRHVVIKAGFPATAPDARFVSCDELPPGPARSRQSATRRRSVELVRVVSSDLFVETPRIRVGRRRTSRR